MYPVATTIAEGLFLKEGDQADLRVEIKDGVMVVTQVLRKTSPESPASEYKAKLGTWNRK
ncbi:MAG: hypothetical protein IAE77_16010 [Prosthecobacter sp.]|uniref:hypothetical protein n=1 Tax=Prosthecobacter sp. TaxID=1965333 RepID=UPI0019E92936|nr:hypothetical protein [Prosthecobacter sp.]MBE2284966.1 hypothetical protein [Prosthecobacter sp.]